MDGSSAGEIKAERISPSDSDILPAILRSYNLFISRLPSLPPLEQVSGLRMSMLSQVLEKKELGRSSPRFRAKERLEQR